MMIPNKSYLFSGLVVTLYLFLFPFVVHTLASPTVHHCRHDQRDALMEFKHEFPVNDSNSSVNDDLSSWNKSSDCCSWEGVTCDVGKVVTLFLNNIPLNNSLKPNSGLFKLQYLQNLSISYCNLYGEIPSSFGNFSHLTLLHLSNNALVGRVPNSIGNLSKLRYLRLSQNYLSGKIPVSFGNLTQLRDLNFRNNYFESELPPDMSGLQYLEAFDASENSLVGSFPTSLFTISSLKWVVMEGNQFKGPIEFGNTSSSSSLFGLILSNNKFDGAIPESLSNFLNLGLLYLSDNNFTGSIPRSMSQLVHLSFLDMSNNKLEGQVPGFLWRLGVLMLSNNSFSTLEKPSEVDDQTQMWELGLDSNLFRGPFPNWICKFSSLNLLDLSKNSFNGSFPQCLRNITNYLRVLNLRNNNFSGILPDVFVNATTLSALDISRNRLEGKLPKSLMSCKAMQLLNMGRNNFEDKFPSWLESLPLLNVLILRSNQLYGPLYHRHVSSGFQNLRVIDVSQNGFTGTIPALYFSNWRGMITSNALYNGTYMEDVMDYSANYRNSMEMVQKGVDTKFERIRKDFIAIDFSENKFSGKIPESIGWLKELRLLNLSGNAFTSNIPQSLGNLTKLEALDLSRNQLLGQIPRDLGTLSFLSTMNFSHNNLEGPIPQSTQFQRQDCSSFMDNPKLYGLEDICGKTHVSNLTPQESDEVLGHEEQEINWIIAAIAYGPGVFCGLVIGHIFVSHKHEWFMEKFHRKKARVVIRSTR